MPTAVTTAPFDHALDARAICAHCGDPCGADAIALDGRAFCCRGCEAVFTLLAEHHLSAFYTCAPNPGVSQRAASRRLPDRFAALDDPGVAARVVTTRPGGAASVRWPVPALHCASCVWLLEQLWRLDDGVIRSEVDLARRAIRIDFRPGLTSPRRIAERLASLGYEPTIDGDTSTDVPPAARRALYLKIGVAGFAFGNVMLFSIPRYANGAPLDPVFQHLFDWLNVAFALPVLVYSASDYFQSAWGALRARAMTLDVPVALGLVVLFTRSLVDIASGRGEGFLDSFSGLVFFLLVGRLFQQKTFDAIAFDRRARSFLPLSVLVDRDGVPQTTPIERIAVGDTMTIRPQEVVPADAVLADASALVDYAFITGEEAPVAVSRGETVSAGGRIVGQTTRLVARGPASEGRLVDLWNAPVFTGSKARALTRLSARFGAWFTAGACCLALAGAIWWWPNRVMAADVATAVLIVACPCALTLAAPVTLGTAMAVLGRNGCYLKQPAVAFDLARVDTVIFDKTGTLTSAADVSIDRRHLDETGWRAVTRLAAESVHPVSRALAAQASPASRGGAATRDDDVDVHAREMPGRGLAGVVDGQRVAIGTAAFVSSETGSAPRANDGRLWAAVGDAPPVPIDVAPGERPGMDEALRALADRYDVWLLSGDRPATADRWRPRFGDRLRFGQSPADKLAAVHDQRAAGRRVLMIGDGLNDAGALAAADVGLAVSDDTAYLVPACDAVIAGGRLAALPAMLRFARRARAVVAACFVVSLVYNAGGLALALAGRLAPITTAVLMPASSITIIAIGAGLTRAAARGLLPA